jgi:hypothetical protein
MSIGPELYGYDPTQEDLTPDQLPAPPASASDLNSALATVHGPELLPLPSQYVEQQFQPTGFGRALEGLYQSYAGQPHQAPRGFGQGFAAALLGSLSGQGARVAEARSKFQSAEDARRRLIDEERKAATAENNRRTGQFGQAKTNALITNSVNQETFNRNEPVRTAAQKRADATAARADASLKLQQDTAARQTRLQTLQTINQFQDNWKQDPQVKAYQDIRSNLKTANEGAKLDSGPGDIALIFAFQRALEPGNVNSVREGEFATASEAAGTLQKYKNLPRRFFKGDRLSDEGRQYFLDEMSAQLKARRPDYDAARQQFETTLREGGIEPNKVVRDFPGVQSLKLKPYRDATTAASKKATDDYYSTLPENQ